MRAAPWPQKCVQGCHWWGQGHPPWYSQRLQCHIVMHHHLATHVTTRDHVETDQLATHFNGSYEYILFEFVNRNSSYDVSYTSTNSTWLNARHMHTRGNYGTVLLVYCLLKTFMLYARRLTYSTRQKGYCFNAMALDGTDMIGKPLNTRTLTVWIELAQ